MSETVELTRDVLVADLPDEGQTVQILASPPECDAIAARVGLPALTSLEATVVVVRVETGGGCKSSARAACARAGAARVSAAHCAHE